MLENLLTEQVNPDAADLDKLPTRQMLELINREDRTVAEAVAREIPAIAKAVDAIAEVLERGGRLFYIGAGTSGRLGVLDASECAPTFGVPPSMIQAVMAGGVEALYKSSEAVEDDAEAGARDLLERGFTARDALVGIAASGRTPYVLGAISAARKMGAVTAGISCAPGSELSRMVDFPIQPATGAEVVAGSTRLKAGTATKLVLNMISTGVMIRLGYVFGNLMVNLTPSNEKLADRARRIIAAAAGIDYTRAAELLEASGNQASVAIYMALRNATREDAVRRLAAAGGRLRRALEENA